MNYTLNLVDPDYGQSQFGRNNISILVNRDGYSFSVADSSQKKILRLAEINLSDENQQLQDSSAYEFFDLLNSGFSKKTIVFHPEVFTFIPNEFYNEKNKADWLEFSNSVPEDRKIFVTELKGIKAKIISSLPLSDFSKLNSLAPGAEFIPLTAILINCFQQLISDKKNDHVLVHKSNEKSQIVVFREDKLLLANSYETPNTDDLMYYLVYIIEQLGLVPQSDFLYLSGDLIEDEFTLSKLASFFSKEQLVDSFSSSLDESFINPATVAKYFPLIQSLLCE